MSIPWRGRFQDSSITWEQYLDIDEADQRNLEIVDGYVVPREQRDSCHQQVASCLSNAVEVSAVEEMRRSGDT
ncbi:hypothetical protein [Nocardia sp. NPDC058705]|uniref:hypothetical protein n=1 Tax=Nocardia sp. NPDC058705 TaxID=3346609 RepID=UPI0036BF9786